MNRKLSRIGKTVTIAGVVAVLFIISARYIQGQTVPTQQVSTPSQPSGRIAFTSRRDGHAQIYVMNADGSNQVNLSQNDFNDSQPAWAPDGLHIAFTSQREGNNEICVMNADGSNQMCLTHQPTPGRKADPRLPQDYSPTWSSDNTQIAFVSTRTGNSDVWAMNADGTNPLNLTQSSSNNDHPAWSPDMKSIVFVSDRDGNTEVCVMDASGFNQRCITNEKTRNRKPDSSKPADSSPAWSPDSQKIVFVSTRERNRNKQIFVVNADGSSPVNITKKISAEDNPSWSPDGNTIVFVSNRDGLIPILYSTSLDGLTQARLTQTNRGGDFFPEWEPNTSHSGTPTQTLTPTPTGTIVFTAQPSDTPTRIRPTITNTIAPPLTNTFTPTVNKPPPPVVPSATRTNTATATPTATSTATSTDTATATSTPTSTATPLPPVLSFISLSASGSPATILQNFTFTAARGDVYKIHYTIVTATIGGLTTADGTITTPVNQQIIGNVPLTGSWVCGSTGYSVTLSAQLLTVSGIDSNIVQYTMNC